MHDLLQSFFLNFVLLFIVFFSDLISFNLIRNFLIFGNFFSLVFIFIELNLKISSFLSSLKCFFQTFKIFVVFALYFFVKIF